MKMSLSVLLILFAVVSCGKKSTSSSSSPGERQNQEYATDIREVDLLDVTADLPIESTGDKIIFKKAFRETASGVRTTCEMNVDAGESYQYRLGSNSLVLTKNNGSKIHLERVSGEHGLAGSWISEKREGRALVARRITFLGNNRVIMRTHCEG